MHDEWRFCQHKDLHFNIYIRIYILKWSLYPPCLYISYLLHVYLKNNWKASILSRRNRHFVSITPSNISVSLPLSFNFNPPIPHISPPASASIVPVSVRWTNARWAGDMETRTRDGRDGRVLHTYVTGECSGCGRLEWFI